MQPRGQGSAVSSSNGVWGGAPAEIEFCTFLPPKIWHLVATILMIFLIINWPNLGLFKQWRHFVIFMTDWHRSTCCSLIIGGARLMQWCMAHLAKYWGARLPPPGSTPLMVYMTLIRPLNDGQGHSFWYQSISQIRLPIGCLFSRTHRNDSQTDRRTQHYTNSATFTTVG